MCCRPNSESVHPLFSSEIEREKALLLSKTIRKKETEREIRERDTHGTRRLRCVIRSSVLPQQQQQTRCFFC
jgi:hypothetical protein